MKKFDKLASDITAYRTYAKYLPTQARRESIEETINRVMTMQLDRFPKLSRDIVKAFQQVHEFKIMPSMRTMQFAGDAILDNSARGYNCSMTHISHPRAFSEALFLLLSGTGVGYSVQKHHVEQLPVIKQPRDSSSYVVPDTIEGWAQAYQALVDAYMYRTVRPEFDFSLIRPKDARINSTGARAPGSEPLKKMLKHVEQKLKDAVGRKLRPVEVSDIVCISSEAVLAGGIRRSACICFFDKTDEEMLNSKSGTWWEKHPYRARANISAVMVRSETTQEEFNYVFDKCIASNAGEPGVYWTNSTEVLSNPCAEISLRNNGFCNLTTINQTGVSSKKDFLNRVYSASLIGTLQAAYTNFPYLSEAWQNTAEQDALLGVSFTGVADANNTISSDWLQEAAKLVLEVNQKYARKIGINEAKRTTCLKPEGSSSLVFGSSSGIHARHSKYYLRRIRMNKSDALAHYLSNTIPELVEEDKFSPTTVVVTIPQQSPDGAITRGDETAITLMNRVLFYYENWIKPGHVDGVNTHSVSVTINYKQDEVDELRLRMWKDRYSYAGISLLPYSDHTYVQAPFEECDEAKFNELSEKMQDVDLKNVVEEQDNTNRSEISSCEGGLCLIS